MITEETELEKRLKPFQLFPRLPLLDTQMLLYNLLLFRHKYLEQRDYLFFIIWINDYVIYLDRLLSDLEDEIQSNPKPFKDMSKIKEYEFLRTEQRFYRSILVMNQYVTVPGLRNYVNSFKPRAKKKSPFFLKPYNLNNPYRRAS